MTLMDLTPAEREIAASEMIAHGAALADRAQCGVDLPCGVCDECLSNAETCAICLASEPSRVWPAVGWIADQRACSDCMENVSSTDLQTEPGPPPAEPNTSDRDTKWLADAIARAKINHGSDCHLQVRDHILQARTLHGLEWIDVARVGHAKL